MCYDHVDRITCEMVMDMLENEYKLIKIMLPIVISWIIVNAIMIFSYLLVVPCGMDKIWEFLLVVNASLTVCTTIICVFHRFK